MLGISAVSRAADLEVVEWNVDINNQSNAFAHGQMAYLGGLSPVPQVVILEEVAGIVWDGTCGDCTSGVNGYIKGLEDATGVTWTGIYQPHCATASGSTCTAPFSNGAAILTSLSTSGSSSHTFFHCDYYVAGRSAVRLAVQFEGSTINVFGVHMQADDPNPSEGSYPGWCGADGSETAPSRVNERSDSVSEFTSWASGFSAPHLIGGDFNSPPTEAAIANTSTGMAAAFTDAWSVGGSGNGYTFNLGASCADTRFKRIDYWFADTGGTLSLQSVNVDTAGLSSCYSGWQSDHLPLRAEYSAGSSSGSSGSNLLEESGFEGYTSSSLGTPGWVSDSIRQVMAVADTSMPHTGSVDGLCSQTTSQDCGMYQEVTAPGTGTYMLIVYANANRTGGLVGANVNGSGAVSSSVAVRTGGYGDPYTMTFSASSGDTIRVWMYSPASSGYVVIDDVSLLGPNLLDENGFEGYSTSSLGTPGWVSDTIRAVAAVADTSHPHTGSVDGLCSQTTSQDCGLYQEVTAPATATYTVSFFANADRTGGLVGVNVNGSGANSDTVDVRTTYGDPYTMSFSASSGDTIRVWMYSPPSADYISVDDVSLTVDH